VNHCCSWRSSSVVCCKTAGFWHFTFSTFRILFFHVLLSKALQYFITTVLVPTENAFCRTQNMALAWTMLSQDVGLSVCPLHTGILSKQFNISLFHHWVATPKSSFFQYRTLWQCSDMDPLIGASNVGGGADKIAVFDHYLAISSKQYKIHP